VVMILLRNLILYLKYQTFVGISICPWADLEKNALKNLRKIILCLEKPYLAYLAMDDEKFIYKYLIERKSF